MSDIEYFEKYWYKPLHDSIKFDGKPDKDLFRYKDLGKQPAFLSWIECSRLKNLKIKELEAQLEKAEFHLKHISECVHPYTVNEHRETLEHRFGLVIEKAREYFESK